MTEIVINYIVNHFHPHAMIIDALRARGDVKKECDLEGRYGIR